MSACVVSCLSECDDFAMLYPIYSLDTLINPPLSHILLPLSLSVSDDNMTTLGDGRDGGC